MTCAKGLRAERSRRTDVNAALDDAQRPMTPRDR
jgi:hypothetical protein